MIHLAWDNKYLVGMEVIDYQHQQIFLKLNEVHTALMGVSEPSETAALMRQLVEAAREHFATEEAILSAAGYPGLRTHRELHRDLLERVQFYYSRYNCGENVMSPHLLNFLRDWLAHHLENADREYSVWLKQFLSTERTLFGETREKPYQQSAF